MFLLHKPLFQSATLTTSTTVCARDHLFALSSFLVFHLIAETEVAVFAAADRLAGRC